MKKSLRKVVAVICCLVLGSSVVLPVDKAFGAENENDNDSAYEEFLNNTECLTFEQLVAMSGTSITYEVDTIRDFQKLSDEQLEDLQVTDSDVEMLRTKAAEEIVLDHAANLSDSILKEKGLSRQSIDNIKSGNYSNLTSTDIRAASSKLAFNIANIHRTRGSANYTVHWRWDTPPAVGFTDKIAAGISNYYATGGGATAVLYYIDQSGAHPQEDRRIGGKVKGSTAVFEIPMTWAYSSSDIRVCLGGRAFVPVTPTSYPEPSILQASAAYIHGLIPKGLPLKVSVNFAGVLSIEFDLSQGLKMAEIYKNIPW